jgi:hypothetical protein
MFLLRPPIRQIRAFRAFGPARREGQHLLGQLARNVEHTVGVDRRGAGTAQTARNNQVPGSDQLSRIHHGRGDGARC